MKTNLNIQTNRHCERSEAISNYHHKQSKTISNCHCEERSDKAISTSSNLQNIKYIFYTIIITIFLFLPTLYASGEFLKIGVGERPCGMGEAFGAVADNVNATYWNPAVLSQISRVEFSIMHMQYIMSEFRINYLGFAIPLRKGVLGIDGRLLTNEDKYRDENGNTTGTFANYNGVGTLAYSYPINKNIYTGFSVKYFYEQYERKNKQYFL